LLAISISGRAGFFVLGKIDVILAILFLETADVEGRVLRSCQPL